MNKLFLFLLFIFLSIYQVHSANTANVKLKAYKEILTKLSQFKAENQKQKLYLTDKNKRVLQFKKTRQKFKAAEYFLGIGNLIEFRRINGPNLTYDAFSGGASQTYKGQGLQKMEELLFSESFSEAEFSNEVDLLNELLEKIYERGQKLNNIPESSFHQIIWEAIRFEIYRMEALGITGFDTPISNWGVQEILPAIDGIMDMVEVYNDSKILRKNYKKDLNTSLKSAKKYISKNNDFNSFDRLFFIKNYLHPISEIIYSIQLENNWIYPVKISGVNISAKNMWDIDFFSEDNFRHRGNEQILKVGQSLFFDKNIHPLKKISCATCHNPTYGLADNTAFNMGARGNTLTRNTPSLWNSAFQTKFYLDGRILKIADQVYEVIHNPDEMDSNLEYILSYVLSNDTYKMLFKNAIGREPTGHDILFAFDTYIRSFYSFNSAFDQYVRNEKTEISPEVKNGFNLFAGKAKCATCHFLPLFNGLLAPFYDETEFEVLGTPLIINGIWKEGTDLGRYNKTQLEIHKRSFKTVGIRNTHLNPPYMHNGAFNTLEELLSFYNNGGGIGHGLSISNQTLPSDSLKLSKQEMNDVISFIKSLEDTVQKRN